MTITNEQKIMVSFKNVHKYFKDLHVINGVNLDIKQGEVVVVCGPSGSGKSGVHVRGARHVRLVRSRP